MAYRGAQVGQIVDYARNAWEPRESAKVVRVYKDNPNLVASNSAIVMLGQDFTFPLHVALNQLYRKGKND